MIKIRNLTFEYFDRDEEGYLTDMINAIRGINFDAKKGEFIAVAGKNGSGKSTFARILNRLLVPIEGTVFIGGYDALDEDNILDIRKKVGMVFQSPDDQLIGSIVAEDVAFGAENIGVKEEEMWNRVMDAVEAFGLDAKMRINDLSGGEKQKVAIAGVLAMKPECIVLDEATSMLDPKSRYELLSLIKELNEKLGITIIMITHLMEELLFAERIYILDRGKLALKGRREEIFSDEERLLDLGLECPTIVNIADLLYKENVIRRRDIFDIDELAEEIKARYPKKFYLDTKMVKPIIEKKSVDPVNAILINNLSCKKGKKTILKDITLQVSKGEYVAIVGETGAGKSTLLQHIPALIKAKTGKVFVDGMDVNEKATDIRRLRCKIGFVFQYPEQQLFAKNVYEDVVFGPRNVGVSEIEAEKRAYEAIELVGLSQDVYDIPISKLSGGQKRRVALAGVLAMKPEYLILDEPLAGLDPAGKQEMLGIIDALHKEAGITIIMVTHDMEKLASYANRVIVMEQGAILQDDSTVNAMYHMASTHTDSRVAPVIMTLLCNLRKKGLLVDCDTVDIKQGVSNIISALKG